MIESKKKNKKLLLNKICITIISDKIELKAKRKIFYENSVFVCI